MSTLDNKRDEHYMLEAIKAAEIAQENGDVPIGAVVVYENQIIGRAYNQREQLADPTGQDENPNAATIRWDVLPSSHGVFVPYTGEPIRPIGDAISVWLRGKTTLTQDYRFEADFDDFALHKVASGAPGK